MLLSQTNSNQNFTVSTITSCAISYPPFDLAQKLAQPVISFNLPSIGTQQCYHPITVYITKLFYKYQLSYNKESILSPS